MFGKKFIVGALFLAGGIFIASLGQAENEIQQDMKGTPVKSKVFYCTSSHWDREWYEPYQEYRMWLVEMIDRLLGLMETYPEFRYFHLDGQAVVLKDYLEIRPENKERLVKLLKERRILAGPWFDLPDEWLISGESFIRNIQLGRRTCQELGFEPLRFAYTPDQFGHIAALPMIMTGMGIPAGVVWRGTEDSQYPTQYAWVGPDGSKMATHKLADQMSYGWPFYAARQRLGNSGALDEEALQSVANSMHSELGRSPISMALMLDGQDHQEPTEMMMELAKQIATNNPDVDFKWGTLEEYGDAISAQVDALPERKGELREVRRDRDATCQYLIVHTISSRYPVKQQNDQCTALLEKWAEPYALFHAMAGGKPVLSYLEHSWEYLVKNHPHDSICGCSIDQVHRDMMYRFDQSRMLADGLVRRAIAGMSNPQADVSKLSGVVVHQPLPFARKGIIELDVLFPGDWKDRFIDGLSSGESVNLFKLVDAEGKVMPFQLSSIERNDVLKQLNDTGRRQYASGDIYHLAVEMELPSCGYTGFRVEHSTEAIRNFGTLRTGLLSAANESVAFELHTDGSACLTNKATGQAFDGLFCYEDGADVGDGWTLGRAVKDVAYRTPGARVSTSVDEDGSLRTVFRVEREFDLPSHVARDTQQRSSEHAILRVEDLIYVEKHAPYVRVRTTVHNNIKDHRLRVVFPTGIAAEKSFAETPFAVVERDVAIPAESAQWYERVNPEKAYTSFFGVQDNAGGLAVLSPAGMHEYEVMEQPRGALALTLFRSTYKTVMTGGEPDGELQGDLTFEYMLYPFGGAFDAVDALHHVAVAQAGVRSHLTEEVPATCSFVRLEKNSAIVTALKPAEGYDPTQPLRHGCIRLWNPGGEEARDTVHFESRIVSAQRCNLAETPIEPIALDADGGIPVAVPPYGLTTVLFEWE